MAQTNIDHRVASVRRFNRFYTRRIGILRERLWKGPFSLAEARVLFELAQSQNTTAGELGKTLGLDAGYLSRILRGFQERGLLARRASTADRRQRVLQLTRAGRHAFTRIDADAQRVTTAILEELPIADQARLIEAMEVIEGLLGAQSAAKVSYVLRPHRPGDMGWVVHRHGVLYYQEYGWDERFEALVAEIVAQFIRDYDPKREHCWIAEKDGQIVGSILLAKHTRTIAKLRLLLVEPRARGSGIGSRLVDECVRFARAAGYQKLALWTNPALQSARSIYEKAGFQMVRAEPHDYFGQGEIGQTWELDLQSPAPLERESRSPSIKRRPKRATGRGQRRKASASRRAVKG
jgi:DNA-binding MarR family transcriptional regulator/GNAT superfamily N-acetyltransferase